MATTSVSARFQELFPETNLISLLTKYGGDADDIFEAIQDRYDAHEQEPLVGLLGIKAANIDTFARAAYWDLVSDIRIRYLSSLPRSEAAAIFARLLADKNGDTISTAANTKFTDIPAHAWYSGYVKYLNNNGVTYGKSGNTFAPDDAITRAEFAAIAARFDNDGDKTAAKFSDIATHWAKDEISIAYNNGWITGYPDGTFGPQRDITRAETMTLVNRVLNRQPETEDDLLPNMTVWTDNANPKAWYYLAVQEATNSHYYKFKTNSKYEKWTELRETRDWTQLEK